MKLYKIFAILFGVTCITFLEALAITQGMNGAALAAACAAITGLLAYLFARVDKK